MTDKEIETKALQALAWARGSWGQGKYDAPKFERMDMVKLYEKIAEIAFKQAILHASSDSVK